MDLRKIREIENFKLSEFLNQDIETIKAYVTILKFIPSQETENEIFHMKLEDVEFFKQNINSSEDSSIIEIVAKVQDIEIEEVLEMEIITFFALLNSIRKQIEKLINAESEMLNPDYVDPRWSAVSGSDRMAKFGIYNTLEMLSNGDILKYQKIMELSYSEVFTVLLMRKTKGDIEREMKAIKI